MGIKTEIYVAAVQGGYSQSRKRIRKELEQMAAEGVSQVVVQPACLIPGIVYELIRQEAQCCAGLFSQLLVGEPLLMKEEDCRRVVQCVMEDYSALGQGEALVWFAHGSSHGVNWIYRRLDELFCSQSVSGQVRLATLRAEPGFLEILEWLKEREIRKVHLAPFMLTTGAHVQREMAGEGRDSWRMRLMETGYEVECHIRGLGDKDEIKRMYLERLHKVIEGLE